MTDKGDWNEATNGAEANADEWREVESEVQIKFEMIGDGFIGRFTGMDPVNANGITQAHFVNVTDLNGLDIADRAFVNLTRDQINKYRVVPVKAMVRDEWTSDMDTGHSSGNKMQVHKVQWK